MLWCAWLLGCPWCWFLAWTLLRWGHQTAFCMCWKCGCRQGQKWAWPKLNLLHNGTWWEDKCCHPARWMGMILSIYCTPPHYFYLQMPQNKRRLQWIPCHPSQWGWDFILHHTQAPDTVGAAETVAKHVAKKQGQWGWMLCPTKASWVLCSVFHALASSCVPWQWRGLGWGTPGSSFHWYLDSPVRSHIA